MSDRSVKPPALPAVPLWPGQHLIAEERQTGWRGWILRMGRVRAVLLITAISLLLSLITTLLVDVLTGDTARISSDLMVATIVPLLVAPVVSGIGMSLLVEVEAARRALREVAIRDGLTNLFNRHYFVARLQTEIERARSDGTPLTVVLIDVDHFKRINDLGGHAAGDDVLQRVAAALIAHVRPCDLTARFGGEEFVALLPGASSAVGIEVAERIRLAIREITVPVFDDPADSHITASLGTATLGTAPETASDLLRRADHAMYAAKANGRNRSVSAAP